EGLGHKRILAVLNDTRKPVPPFGKVVVNKKRTRSQFCGRWTRPYLANILNDRRSVGEFQPRKLGGEPDGPPLPNYFPAPGSEEEYLAARHGQMTRKLGGESSATERKYVNVFRGLLKHARDGEGFFLENRERTQCPQLVLVSGGGRCGRGRC